MIFWAGIILAVILATLWAKRGFYDTWTFAINCILSIYIGIFAEPFAVSLIPSAAETPFGDLLVVAGLAVGSFVILQSISLVCALGHFSVPFPKFLDVTASGLLGFLTGLVIWNFGAFVICNAPAFSKDLAAQVNYDNDDREFNISVFSIPCDIIHLMVSRQDEYGTQKAVATIFTKIENEQQRKIALQIKKNTKDPNEPKKQTTKEILGPPPEIESEGI
jgi:hypothetical protein